MPTDSDCPGPRCLAGGAPPLCMQPRLVSAGSKHPKPQALMLPACASPFLPIHSFLLARFWLLL